MACCQCCAKTRSPTSRSRAFLPRLIVSSTPNTHSPSLPCKALKAVDQTSSALCHNVLGPARYFVLMQGNVMVLYSIY